MIIRLPRTAVVPKGECVEDHSLGTVIVAAAAAAAAVGVAGELADTTDEVVTGRAAVPAADTEEVITKEDEPP